MACKGCEKKNAGMRCCLCSRNVLKPAIPWGKTRKICSYCKDKQLALIQERLDMNKRAETLMKGRDYIKKSSKKVEGLVK